METKTELMAPGQRSMSAGHGGEHEWSVQQIVAQTTKIQECMKAVMKKGEHYGVIPGTGDRKDESGKTIPPKPTLLKPGAEKLCLMFRLDPEYDVMQSIEEPTRISYMVRCTLFHIPTGNRIASGVGSCNSREDKYMRAASKKCPSCGKDAIKRSKFPDRDRPADAPGWYCYAKVGGCGANFRFEDQAVTEQETGIKDPADLANTILKMACKRALIAAVLNGTAASDCFTQDLEDLHAAALDVEEPRAAQEQRTQQKAAPKPEAPNDVQLQKIAGLLKEIGWARQHTTSWLKKHFDVATLSALSPTQATEVIANLEAELAEAKDRSEENIS